MTTKDDAGGQMQLEEALKRASAWGHYRLNGQVVHEDDATRDCLVLAAAYRREKAAREAAEKSERALAAERSYQAENHCPYGGHALDGSTCRYCHWKVRPEPGALARELIERIRCEFSATAMNAGEETGYCDTCAGFELTGWDMDTVNKVLDKVLKAYDAIRAGGSK